MKDLMPDFGNLPALENPQEEKEKVINPIGKEDIRIPVEISYKDRKSTRLNSSH